MKYRIIYEFLPTDLMMLSCQLFMFCFRMKDEFFSFLIAA